MGEEPSLQKFTSRVDDSNYHSVVCILLTPPLGIGCDSKSIFQQCTSGLNSKFTSTAGTLNMETLLV